MSSAISPEVQQDIIDAMGHYATAVDRGDHEELYSAFAPDGWVRHPNGDRFVGRDGLREWLDMLIARPDHFGRQHIVANRKWSANDDGSVTIYSYWLYFIHREGEDPRLGGQGYYEDTMVEHDGGWVFRERYVDHWNDERALMSPGWTRA